MHYGANGRLTLAWDSPGMLEGETATLTLGASSPVFGAGYDYEVVLFGAERRVPSPEFFAVASPRWVVAPGWTGTLYSPRTASAGDSILSVQADFDSPLHYDSDSDLVSLSASPAGALLRATLTALVREEGYPLSYVSQTIEVSVLAGATDLRATTAAGTVGVLAGDLREVAGDYPGAVFGLVRGPEFSVRESGVIWTARPLSANRTYELTASAVSPSRFVGTLTITARVFARAGETDSFGGSPFFGEEINYYGMRYYGPRRGLIASYSAGDVAAGAADPSGFCAQGAGEGWRAPTAGEVAALLTDVRDSATLTVHAPPGVERVYAGFDSSFALSVTESRNGEALPFARVYADFYALDDGETRALPIEADADEEGKFVAGLSEEGRVVCVQGPEASAPSFGVIASLTGHRAYGGARVAGGAAAARQTLTITAMSPSLRVDIPVNAWRPHGVASVGVSLAPLEDSQGRLFGAAATDGGFLLSVIQFLPGEGGREVLTLRVSPPGESRVAEVAVLAIQPDALFAGTPFFEVGDETPDGYVRYLGRRRGAVYAIGNEGRAYHAETFSYCEAGAAEGWRRPTMGEAMGLLSDEARVRLGFVSNSLGPNPPLVVGYDVVPPPLEPGDAPNISALVAETGSGVFTDLISEVVPLWNVPFAIMARLRYGTTPSATGWGEGFRVCVLPGGDYDYPTLHPGRAHFGDWETAAALGATSFGMARFSNSENVRVFHRLTARVIDDELVEGGGTRTLSTLNALTISLAQPANDFAAYLSPLADGTGSEIALSLANPLFRGEAVVTVWAVPFLGAPAAAVVSVLREAVAGRFGDVGLREADERATLTVGGTAMTFKYGGASRGLHAVVQVYSNEGDLSARLVRPSEVCAAANVSRVGRGWRVPSLGELAGLRAAKGSALATIRLADASAPGLAANEAREIVLNSSLAEDAASPLGTISARVAAAYYTEGVAGHPDSALGVAGLVDGVMPLVQGAQGAAIVCVTEVEETGYVGPPDVVEVVFEGAPSRAALGAGDSVSLVARAFRLDENGNRVEDKDEALSFVFFSDSAEIAFDTPGDVRSGSAAVLARPQGGGTGALSPMVATATIVVSPQAGTGATATVEVYPPFPVARFAEGTGGEAVIYSDGPRMLRSFRAETREPRLEGSWVASTVGVTASLVADDVYFELEEQVGGASGPGAANFGLHLKTAGVAPTVGVLVSLLAWPVPGPGLTAVYVLTTRPPTPFAAFPNENGIEFDRVLQARHTLTSTIAQTLITLTARAYAPGFRGPRRSDARLTVSLISPLPPLLPGFPLSRDAFSIETRNLTNGIEMVVSLDDFSRLELTETTLTALAFPASGHPIDDAGMAVVRLVAPAAFGDVPLWATGTTVRAEVALAGSAYGYTMSYHGRRRGLHAMVGEPEHLPDLAAGVFHDDLLGAVCAAGGEGWRLPSLLETAMLQVDDNPVSSILGTDISIAGGRGSFSHRLPPPEDGDAAGVSGPIVSGLYGDAGRERPRLARVETYGGGAFQWLFDAGVNRRVACVRPALETYSTPPDPAGILGSVILSSIEYEEAGLRATVFRFSTWRYGPNGTIVATDNAPSVSGGDAAGFELFEEGDGVWRGEILIGRLANATTDEIFQVALPSGWTWGGTVTLHPIIPVSHFGGLAARSVGSAFGSFAATSAHNGTVIAATIAFVGRRRGLDVAESVGELPDGFQESLCAAGSGEGWRLPNWTEAQGLTSDGATVLATLESGATVLGVAGTLAVTPRGTASYDVGALSGGWADAYRETTDSESGLQLAYGVGARKVVCVLPKAWRYAKPIDPAEAVFVLDGAVSATAAAMDREEAEFSLLTRAHRRTRGGALEVAEFPVVRMTSAHTLFAEFYTLATSEADAGELRARVQRLQEAPPPMTLTLLASHSRSNATASFSLEITLSPDTARYNGVKVSGGEILARGLRNGLADTSADVLLRYYRARGLHYLVSDAPLTDGYQEAACALGGARADNVWRLPTIGEALALTEDSFAVAATTALPLGFETGLTLFLATGDNAVSEATRTELRTDGIYADLYVAAGEGGEMNAAVNAHDFSARTGRIACVSPVYPEVYVSPATPAGLRWEDEDGDAFEGPVSRSVSQLASPTVVFLAARARAYRLTREGEVLVSLTGRVSVDVRTTLGGTFYDFDSGAGVVRLSGEPGAAELFAAQEYNGFYGAAISLSVSAGRSARVYFGGQLMGSRGFDFVVSGVSGENTPADVGPITITATYHGVVRGMHVVRSELGERFTPHEDNELDFEVYFGPYSGDSETGIPLRPIGYQRNFCAAGNEGQGDGWRAASLAELAALQIGSANYRFKHETNFSRVEIERDGVVSTLDAGAISEGAVVTLAGGAVVTVVSDTGGFSSGGAELGGNVQVFDIQNTLASRVNIPNGTYDIRLGPPGPGDSLLPDIHALPDDLWVNAWPTKNGNSVGSGDRNAGVSAGIVPGQFYFADKREGLLYLLENRKHPDNFRYPMSFVARHRLPANYKSRYFRSDGTGEGYVDGAVYVCVKDAGEREPLPLAGRVRFDSGVIRIRPPFSRVLARNKVAVLHRNQRWEEVPHQGEIPLELAGAPDHIGLETKTLPDGETQVDVVLLDRDKEVPPAVTVIARAIGGEDRFAVVRDDASAAEGAPLVFDGNTLTVTMQTFTAAGVTGVFQAQRVVNGVTVPSTYPEGSWWQKWRGIGAEIGDGIGQDAITFTATYLGRLRGLHYVASPMSVQIQYGTHDVDSFLVFNVPGGYTGGPGVYNGGNHADNTDIKIGLDGYQDDFCRKGNDGGGSGWRLPTMAEVAGVSTHDNEVILHNPLVGHPYHRGYRMFDDGERLRLHPRERGDFDPVFPPIMTYSDNYRPFNAGTPTENIAFISDNFMQYETTYGGDETPFPLIYEYASRAPPSVYLCVKEAEEGYEKTQLARGLVLGSETVETLPSGVEIRRLSAHGATLFSPARGEVVLTVGAHKYERFGDRVVLDQPVSVEMIGSPRGFHISDTRYVPESELSDIPELQTNGNGLYEIKISAIKPLPSNHSTMLTLQVSVDVGVVVRVVWRVSDEDPGPAPDAEPEEDGVYFANTRLSDFNGENFRSYSSWFFPSVEYNGTRISVRTGYFGRFRGLEIVYAVGLNTEQGGAYYRGDFHVGAAEAYCEAGNAGRPERGWRLASLMELLSFGRVATQGNQITVRRTNASNIAGLLRDGEWSAQLPPVRTADEDVSVQDHVAVSGNTRFYGVASDLPTNYRAADFTNRHEEKSVGQVALATGSELRALERVVPYELLYVNHDPQQTLGRHTAVCVRDIDPDNPVNLPLVGNAEGPDRAIVIGPFSEIVAKMTVSVVGRDNRWRPILRSTPMSITIMGNAPEHFNLETRALPGLRTEVVVISSDPSKVADTSALTVRASPSFGGHKDITVRLLKDDSLYFGDERLVKGGDFQVRSVAGSHSSDVNINARITVSASYRGVIRGMHVVHSELGSARTGRGSRTGYSYHAGPSGADGRRDGYQENFCASGNTGSGYDWRAASLAELAAVQLSASVVTLRDAASAPDDKNNLAAGDYVLHLGALGLAEGPLLPNIHSGPSDLFLNATYTTGTRDGAINYNVSGGALRPSNGVVPFQLQASERNGNFLRNNTIEDFVYVCVKDADGAGRDWPRAGNASVNRALVRLSAPLSRTLARATVSVSGRDRNWNEVWSDDEISADFGSASDYMGIETALLRNGGQVFHVVNVVVTGAIAAEDALPTVIASIYPRLGGAATLELRFEKGNWREELSAFGAEAERLATERARLSRTEFDGEVLVLGDALTREVVHADTLTEISVQYRGRRRGLYFATAEPELQLPNWHQLRDDVCAMGGLNWRAASFTEALGGGRNGGYALVENMSLIPGLSNDAIELTASDVEDDEAVIVGGIVDAHGVGRHNGENVYLQLSPSNSGGAMARLERVDTADATQPIVCVRPVEPVSYVRPADAVERILYDNANGGEFVVTATAYWPAQVGAEVYEHPGFVFAAEARRRAKDDDDWVDFDEALTIVSHPDYPVADAGVAEGRQQYRVEVNPGLARPGFVFDVTLHTGLGAVESFQLSVSLVTVPRVPVGLSFGGQTISALEDVVVLSDVRNVLDDSVADVSLYYYGVRRGLHVARTTADFADGWQENVCAAGSDEGWRLAGFAEIAGAATNEAGVSDYEIGEEFAGGRSVALEFDSLGRAYRPVPPMFAGGGLAWVDAYSDVLRDDGKAPGGAGNHLGLQAASVANAARIVCVREVSDDYVRPPDLGRVSFSESSLFWPQSAVAPSRLTITATMRRRVRDGSVVGAAALGDVARPVAPYQVRRLVSQSSVSLAVYAVYRTATVEAGRRDVALVARMGFEATLVLNVLASEEPVVFAGANVFGGGAAALGAVNLLNGTVADVTLRHYGPRRGLHYLYTAADFADGYQDDICGRDESWRLPTFGEAGALFGNYLAVLEADAETEGAGFRRGGLRRFRRRSWMSCRRWI